MEALRALLDREVRWVGAGKRRSWLRPLVRAQDTLLFLPTAVALHTAHARDAINLQRIAAVFILALLPCALWGVYNAGLQANLALDPVKLSELAGWRHDVIRVLGVGYSPASVTANVVHGALYYLPLYLVVFVVGRAWEWLFAAMRGRDMDEGFWITAFIFPLILPPAIPLWQAALAISWGVVIAKQVFGGTGMNILNTALVGRAFLFYAYPDDIVTDNVWTAVPAEAAVDGYTSATVLHKLRHLDAPFADQGYSWWNAFIGLEPGSIGETSVLMCLIGAAILIWTRVASWRIMAGVVLGTVAAAELLNAVGSSTNPGFAIPFWWHMVLGSWAFGAVFLAADPVASAFTERGRWIYGFLIGALIVLVRVLNPIYAEAVMLSILFMNVFAPLIDYAVIRGHVRRRRRRREA
jgi:Na+-transporting NADH:ubiquinone oxidoreductase subunit B